MGYDISYHPIKEAEIEEWYFGLFEDLADNCFDKVDELADKHGLEDFYRQKYKDTLRIGIDTQPQEAFDKSHGYYMAVIQGFFRTYFYTRGAAFSFLINDKPHYRAYTKPWQQIQPYNWENPIANQITENYSSGIYLPPEKLEQLLTDYHAKPAIKAELDAFFSDGRITVFLKALDYCRENGLGLLEATEVVEPNPIDLNSSACYSNLFNCDLDGPILYRDTARQQLSEMEKQQQVAPGSIAQQATYVTRVTGPPQSQPRKKSFWSKLFGSKE